VEGEIGASSGEILEHMMQESVSRSIEWPMRLNFVEETRPMMQGYARSGALQRFRPAACRVKAET
jgi:hypothetical protein